MAERRSGAGSMATGVPSAVAVALAAFLVDQVTKFVSAWAGTGLGGFNLPARNTEISLGVATAPWLAQIALMAVCLVAGGAALLVGVRRGLVPGWAAGLVIGGALSNLADRALLGSVRDFLVVGPVIVNIADLAVVLGVLAALFAARPVRTRPLKGGENNDATHVLDGRSPGRPRVPDAPDRRPRLPVKGSGPTHHHEVRW